MQSIRLFKVFKETNRIYFQVNVIRTKLLKKTITENLSSFLFTALLLCIAPQPPTLSPNLKDVSHTIISQGEFWRLGISVT